MMITEARVISTHGSYAVVQVNRKSACDGCHKNSEGNSCSICTLVGGDSKISVRAHNAPGAHVGDIVSITTATRRVLGYAWLVFLMPLILAAVGWWVGDTLIGGQMYGAVFAVLGMVICYIGIWLYSRVLEKRRPDAEIVEIIVKDENNISNTKD